jgi:hypothetical protein
MRAAGHGPGGFVFEQPFFLQTVSAIRDTDAADYRTNA